MDNAQKNSYVRKQIANALIDLLRDKELKDISVSEITRTAQVGRMSFYRNYTEKEDILRQHISELLLAWQKDFEAVGSQDMGEMWGSLFSHFNRHRDFYLLLYRRGLSLLLLDSVKAICGPKKEQGNLEAYFAAFMSHGLYGWIDEWFARGMEESAEIMAVLLRQGEDIEFSRMRFEKNCCLPVGEGDPLQDLGRK